MNELKLIKLKCTKMGKYMGAKVKKIGSKWSVVDVIPLTNEEGAVITSEVTQRDLETNVNLQSCHRCGSRKIGGCSHITCPTNKDVYNFQCVYCKSMIVDNSRPTSLGGYKAGGTITLSQGQTIKLQSPTGGSLKKIKLCLNWDPARIGSDMDVDSSVFVKENRNWDVVYFANLTHPSGAIIHHGDNLTGENRGQEYDESIDIDLLKAQNTIDRMIIVINVYKCVARRQTLGDIKNPYLSIWDVNTGTKLVEYRVMSNLTNKTALVVGSLTKEGSEWSFKAIGRGSNASDLYELLSECVRRD